MRTSSNLSRTATVWRTWPERFLLPEGKKSEGEEGGRIGDGGAYTTRRRFMCDVCSCGHEVEQRVWQRWGRGCGFLWHEILSRWWW